MISRLSESTPSVFQRRAYVGSIGVRRACAQAPGSRPSGTSGTPPDPAPGSASSAAPLSSARFDAALDALGPASPRAWPSRASRGSASRGCSPSCAGARRRAATSCSRAPPPSSSATCPTASGSRRSTPTSPSQAARATPSWWPTSPARCRRCGGGREPRGDERHRAAPRDPPAADAARRARAARAGARRPALERRRVGRAARLAACAAACRRGVLLALGYRTGRAPHGLAATLAAPRSTVIELATLERGATAARSPATGSLRPATPRSSARAAATRSTRCSSRARAGAGAQLVGGPHGQRQRRPAGGRGRAARGARGAHRRPRGGCSTPARSPATRSSPSSPTRSPSSTPDAGIAALDELLDDAPAARRPTVPRRFAFRHPLVRRAVYESDRRRLADGRARPRGRGAGGARRGAPRARPSRRAVRGRGRRGRDRAAARGRRRRPRRARPPPPRAGSRPPCGCSPRTTRAARLQHPGRPGAGAALDRRPRALRRAPHARRSTLVPASDVAPASG